MKLFSWYNRIPLIYRNLGAFVLGCAAGMIIYQIGAHCGGEFLEKTVSILSPFGAVLVNMLKMIVIPIIFFSLIHGAASLPTKTFGKMGVGVCSWYFFTSLYAAVFGSIIALLFNPKLSSANELAGKLASQVEKMQSSASEGGNAFINIVLGLFTNPFKALSDGNFLPVIVFAIIFGLAARVVLDTAADDGALLVKAGDLGGAKLKKFLCGLIAAYELGDENILKISADAGAFESAVLHGGGAV